MKKWKEFVADPEFGFRYHVGLSGTCYIGNDYFPDVVHRYSIRDAIADRWVKEVFYVTKDDSSTRTSASRSSSPSTSRTARRSRRRSR